MRLAKTPARSHGGTLGFPWVFGTLSTGAKMISEVSDGEKTVNAEFKREAVRLATQSGTSRA
jgi:hypothetical protein